MKKFNLLLLALLTSSLTFTVVQEADNNDDDNTASCDAGLACYAAGLVASGAAGITAAQHLTPSWAVGIFAGPKGLLCLCGLGCVGCALCKKEYDIYKEKIAPNEKKLNSPIATPPATSNEFNNNNNNKLPKNIRQGVDKIRKRQLNR